MSRTRIIRAAVTVLLGLGPVVAFAAIFGRTPTEALTDPRYTVPVAGAALLPAAVCLLLALTTRIPPVTRLTAGLAALAAYVALVLPARVADGPHHLLTSLPPIDPSGPELATVALVSGLATVGAVEPALRRTAVGWSLPAPLLATTAGLALGAAAGAPRWLAPAIAVTCLLVLALSARDRQAPTPADAPRERRIMAGVTLAVLVVAGAGASQLGPILLAATGTPPPVDAHDLVDQPVRPREDTSPLAQFPALRSGKLPLRFSVTADHGMQRLRYATLDTFDGTYWTSTATYWRASQRLPEATATGPVELVEEQISVEEPGPLGWLPSSGRPVEVSVGGLGVDRSTGDVALPDDRPIPTRFRVRSAVPRPDIRALRTDLPVHRPPGDLPASLTARAADIVGTSSGHAALRRLADHFADGRFTTDTSSRPPAGHGLYQIERLLRERRGTAEQYASAFAVLARSLGYDARVVVGFRPDEPGSAGRYRITGRNVDAWAEVRFAQAGWVAFHPTPGQRSDDRAEQAEPEPTTEPELAPTLAAPPAAATPGPAGATPVGGDSTGFHWSWLLLVLVAPVLLAAGVPLLRAGVRLRRRRASTPYRRAFGAWHDTLDRLVEARLAVGPAMTTGEVTQAAVTRFPAVAGPMRELTRLIDRVAYAPGDLLPSSADEAWVLADAIRPQLIRALPGWHRVTTLVLPRRNHRGR